MILNIASQPQQGNTQLQGLQVSLTPAANLPPGPLIPMANHQLIRIFATTMNDTSGKFVAVNWTYIHYIQRQIQPA